MEKLEQLYEGKAKKIYKTTSENTFWVEYKNSVTAFNGEKKDEIEGKGALNNKISSRIFKLLEYRGIHSHFIEQISETEQLVKRVEIIPIEVVVRNIVAGSMSKRLGIHEGTQLNKPIVEFYYKNDELNDPLITTSHIRVLGLADKKQVQKIKEMALSVNQVLQDIFEELEITLVDFKLEFGIDSVANIVLADEISPDTCRLWDKKNNEKLDKDLYRRDLGDIISGYEKVYNKLLEINK